jgi:hypothetical protein
MGGVGMVFYVGFAFYYRMGILSCLWVCGVPVMYMGFGRACGLIIPSHTQRGRKRKTEDSVGMKIKFKSGDMA